VLPQGAYGLTKRWGEEACRLYAPDGLVVFRPSMPYGPGAPPGRGRRAMDTMLWQAHHRMPITVHRGAERSWCWVGDTVRGIRYAIEQPAAGVYNIGRDDDPRSMLDIARLACKLAGAPEDLIVERDAPPGQTVVKRLATERLRRLDWHPTVELEDGMQRVYEHVRRYDADGVLR
jgi:nucleoside-diphosphate-sugar epimerase